MLNGFLVFAKINRLVAYLCAALVPYIEIDRRSLALMRVLSALVVLVDLVTRLAGLSALYGIDSVMPPEALLHLGNGHTWLPFLPYLIQTVPHFPLMLFIAAFVSVFFVLLGYRTRLNTPIAWILLLMIQSMNVFVLSGADTVVRLIFFLGMFLPWGDYFSVDRAVRCDTYISSRIGSLWTFALLLQISCIYLAAALIKSTGVYWQNGSAAYYALSTDIVTPLGLVLLHIPSVLPFLTHAVPLFQLSIIFLIFFPLYTTFTRSLAMTLLICMHVSFAFLFYLGIFSWISVALLSCLAPGEFWRWAHGRLKERFGNITIYYDGNCGFCKKVSSLIQTFFVPHAEIEEAQKQSAIYSEMQKHDSWVVVDENGERSFSYSAAIALAAHSPFLFFLVPIMRRAPIRYLGERTYRYVADHRSHACPPERPVRASSPKGFAPLTIASAVCAIAFMVAISVWNAGTIIRIQKPAIFVQIMETTGVAQSWRLFSPTPRLLNYWYVADGTTSSGAQVSVFDMPYPYTDDRWRKYFQRISAHENRHYRRYFLAYLCNTWKVAHPEAESLTRIDLYFVYIPTLPDYQTSSPHTLSSGSTSCG